MTRRRRAGAHSSDSALSQALAAFVRSDTDARSLTDELRSTPTVASRERDHTDTHCPEVLLPLRGPRSDSWPSLPAPTGGVGPVSAPTRAGARALRLACGSSVLTDVLRQLALAVRVSGRGLPRRGNGWSSRTGFFFRAAVRPSVHGPGPQLPRSDTAKSCVPLLPLASPRRQHGHNHNPLLPTTSDQTRRPAELKHISKRRKRN